MHSHAFSIMFWLAVLVGKIVWLAMLVEGMVCLAVFLINFYHFSHVNFLSPFSNVLLVQCSFSLCYCVAFNNALLATACPYHVSKYRCWSWYFASSKYQNVLEITVLLAMLWASAVLACFINLLCKIIDTAKSFKILKLHHFNVNESYLCNFRLVYHNTMHRKNYAITSFIQALD